MSKFNQKIDKIMNEAASKPSGKNPKLRKAVEKEIKAIVDDPDIAKEAHFDTDDNGNLIFSFSDAPYHFFSMNSDFIRFADKNVERLGKVAKKHGYRTEVNNTHSIGFYNL
jgi:hypothetical protein